ncbi:TPA: C40 family peptidase [Citrobacter amalonaticus]|uniref:C40 family peptidase n=1 Tax=Citrobacter amalonaticus TaxID=35703 RepID=A0A9C7QR48_CITAM|nr:C40 family peptidase [Citrobacter amalonaticus]
MNSKITLEQNESLLDKKITVLLDRRARFVRWTNLGLISVLVSAAVMVAFLILSGKDSQRSWISEAMTSFNKKSLQAGDLVMFRAGKDNEAKVGVYIGNNKFIKSDSNSSGERDISINNIKDSEAVQDASDMVRKKFREQFGLGQLEKSESEKIADSIATVLLNLSLIIFIGFVMKAVLVFIRYYMQLGTDFENQKLAYVLSKGHVGDFSIILKNLRENSINFEKTPTLPQEKIILSLIKSIGKLGEKK